MRYRVLGHSRDNGQKMTLEVEAKSKADAERQGERQNLKIIRAELMDVGEGDAREGEWRTIAGRRAMRVPWLVLFFIAVVGAGYYFWPVIAGVVHGVLPTPHATAPSTQSE